MTEYAMPSITGYLWKTDPNAKHWRRRYFVLTGNKLGYRKKASSSVFLKEPVDLSLATIYETPDNALQINQKTKYGFRVIMDDGSRTYNLCAVSAEERNDWCYHIADVCNPAAEEDSSLRPLRLTKAKMASLTKTMSPQNTLQTNDNLTRSEVAI